jgi:release factor glutamine methyltransferase
MSAVAKLQKTLGGLRREAAQKFRAAAIESAEADARALLVHATGLEAAKLLSADRDEASQTAIEEFERAIARRISGEPVARIIGKREFWSLSFALGSETLVPRPETETIVEAALEQIGDKRRQLAVLDLGTGSGAILAALLTELPNARGVAIDRSEAALAIARANLEGLSLHDRVTYVCGDWATALAGTFDLIVSNPPYVTSAELALLSPEVREHDPALALDGGLDGLDAYRAIVNQIEDRLAANGVAVLELGIGQEADVAALVHASDRLAIKEQARRDLAGIPRALVIHAKR